MVAQPVGGSVERDDDGAVEEPVEHRSGDGGIAEDLAPGPDGPIRRDHDRRLEVALVDDLEQRRCSLGRQRQIPQFVNLCRHRHKLTYADSAIMPTPPE